MAQSDVFLRHRIHVAWPVLNSVNKADTPGCVRVCVCACVLSGWSQLRPLCRSAELSAAAPCYLILALSLLGRKARLFPTLGEHVVPGMNRDPEAPPLLVTRHFSLSLSLSLTMRTKIKFLVFQRCCSRVTPLSFLFCFLTFFSSSVQRTPPSVPGSDSMYSGFLLSLDKKCLVYQRAAVKQRDVRRNRTN